MEEVIDITPISLDENFSLKSSNFGDGIELLMNDKQKENITLEMNDLNRLEDELNNLSAPKNSFFPEEVKNVTFENLGEATANTTAPQQTWDGFKKFNEIPPQVESSTPNMNKEELLREKLKYLRKLENLEKKGVELTKKYTMDSCLQEMIGEYEMIMEEKSKQNSVKFQGNMMMALINGIEFLNGKFDPFDVKLDGWGEQIGENISDYDEIFGELHEKYKSKATIAPELKLLFQLGGSALMVHMTNTMFKSAMPGMDDIFRQNPDLMKHFQSAAVNSMSNSNPGFAGFMNNVMESNIPSPQQPTYQQEKPNNTFFNDGIQIQENYQDSFINLEKGQKSSRQRPDMKGPTDLDDILSGLKTKTINIQQQPNENNSSTISISDLKELQTEGNLPKRSKRKSNRGISLSL
jgi:hypothetical protein